MKSMTFRNIFNGERFVCDDVRMVEVIDNVEYLIVHRPDEHRIFKMRKDVLEKVNIPVTQRNKSTTLRMQESEVRILPGVPINGDHSVKVQHLTL